MALFGPLATLRSQLAHDRRFAAAFAYATDLLDPGSAAHRRLLAAKAGDNTRIELTGGAFALEQIYQTRARAEGFFESHRKYIDFQLIGLGEELMEVEDIARLKAGADYDAERDFIKYADTAAASRLRMRTGDLAVFFPEDGHMPALQLAGPALMRKCVVKVPVG